MAHVFITGSGDGLGRLAAKTLLDDGHAVVVHARNETRLEAVRGLVERGATALVGDLSNVEDTRALAATSTGSAGWTPSSTTPAFTPARR